MINVTKLWFNLMFVNSLSHHLDILALILEAYCRFRPMDFIQIEWLMLISWSFTWTITTTCLTLTFAKPNFNSTLKRTVTKWTDLRLHSLGNTGTTNTTHTFWSTLRIDDRNKNAMWSKKKSKIVVISE